jgi:hypothetical protein
VAAAILAASLVTIVACGDDDDDGGAAPGGVTATTTGELGEATTAIEVRVPTTPRYVRGADGKVHLEFDIITTTTLGDPVSLTSLVVRDEERELLRLDSDALKAVTTALLGADHTLDIPASGALASIVDVILPTDSYRDVPTAIVTEVTYTIADDAPFRTLVKELTASPVVEIPKEEDPIVIQPPLRGDGWWAFNACCTFNAHRYFLLSSNGTLHAVEMFAIDWVKLVDGKPFKTDGSTVEDFFGYGQTIYAATDGEVMAVRNDLPEAPLNESMGGNPTVKTSADYGGNGLTVKIDDHRYALYGHMQPGSITHEVGDKLKAGDPVGRLGSTGNSTIPHLHFGIQETQDGFASNSVPYVISSYTVTGTGTLGESGVDITPQDSPQQETLPLAGDVMDFGD